MLERGKYIHDGLPPPKHLSEFIVTDINALYFMFHTGQRAGWQLAISQETYNEIQRTRDPEKRVQLELWVNDLWQYWIEIIKDEDLPDFNEVIATRRNLLSSRYFEILPDHNDRVLICDAIMYQCDCFLTRDWNTILKYRDELKVLPFNILSPSEWWEIVKPYRGLWL